MESMSNEQNTLSPAPFSLRTYEVTGTRAGQDRAKRHNQALYGPRRTADEARIMGVIKAAHDAAAAFPADGFGLPEVLLPMIQAARAALNFETGRLDCGTLDGGLVTLARNLGIDDADL